jgi:hypothetical protein
MPICKIQNSIYPPFFIMHPFHVMHKLYAYGERLCLSVHTFQLKMLDEF